MKRQRDCVRNRNANHAHRIYRDICERHAIVFCAIAYAFVRTRQLRCIAMMRCCDICTRNCMCRFHMHAHCDDNCDIRQCRVASMSHIRLTRQYRQSKTHATTMMFSLNAKTNDTRCTRRSFCELRCCQSQRLIANVARECVCCFVTCFCFHNFISCRATHNRIVTFVVDCFT